MSETNAIHTQHPPAVKVGGRRLSASRHNPHNVKCVLESPFSSDQPHLEANFQVGGGSGTVDYPRPGPPPDFVRRANLNIETTFGTTSEPPEASNPFGHVHNQYEEESPKTEKKNHQHMMNDLEKLSRVSSNWESKRPTKNHIAQNNPRRIDQPAEKGL